MTGINVPELIRTTVHRLTHPKGYEKIVQKYIQDVGMERQKSGQRYKCVQYYQMLQICLDLIESNHYRCM